MLSRRELICGTLSIAATSLGGCATFVSPITAFCPDDPRISDPHSPLTIDVHAHVFNGTDVPVERFITLVQHLPGLGAILAAVDWALAPTGAQEIAVLRQINQLLSTGCGPGAFQRVFLTHRSDQYRIGVSELKQAVTRVEKQRFLRSTPDGRAAAAAIQKLPSTYSGYRSARLKARNANPIDAVLAFVIQSFQYRYASAFDFLVEYDTGSPRKIDLAICHFLDFDWPLAGGYPTITSISDQINVMEQISILTGGRVHCYVPFDPMKQVAHDLGYATDSPIGLVQRAITSQGFVGVKIYPPMGFAPIENAHQNPRLWHKSWLPQALQRSDFGYRLDNALRELYSWCKANSVPIMAHTSRSEGPSCDFEALTAAHYWQRVPNGLRVNFGHFGNTEIAPDCLDRAKDYSRLMGPPGSHGANFYADAAYFTRVMTNPDSVTMALQTLFLEPQAPILKQRLMYGSDWEMLLIAGSDSANYLTNFERIVSNLPGQDDFANRFFGANAADYLLLRSGSATRSRLESFYAQRGVRKPQWAQKVDSLPTVVA
jgi:Amidohydrolase